MSERDEILKLTTQVAAIEPKLDGMIALQTERHINTQRNVETNEADIENLYRMKSDDRQGLTVALEKRDVEFRKLKKRVDDNLSSGLGASLVWRRIWVVTAIIISALALLGQGISCLMNV